MQIYNKILLPVLIAVTFMTPALAAPTGKTKGFVITKLITSIYEGDNECPDGFTVGPDPDAVVAKFPPAERARLRRPENLAEYGKFERNRGPDNTDVCAFP